MELGIEGKWALVCAASKGLGTVLVLAGIWLLTRRR